MQLYEILIDDKDSTGVNIISLVNTPAIDELFVKMNSVEAKLQLSDEKQIVLGAVLVPDKLIYRERLKDGKLEQFNIVFRKETIEQIAMKFLNSNNVSNVDVEHNEILLNNVNIVSSYILSDDLKDNRFNHLPNGSWIVAYKIEDKELWNSKIKTGEVKGFSIDGFFNLDKVEMAKDVDINDLINNILQQI